MALKIVYKICCGIDVHKTFVVACIASTDSKGVTTYEHHRFSTYTKGLKDVYKRQVFVPFSCVGSRTVRLDRIYKGPVFKRLFLLRTVWRGCLLLSAEARDLLFLSLIHIWQCWHRARSFTSR